MSVPQVKARIVEFGDRTAAIPVERIVATGNSRQTPNAVPKTLRYEGSDIPVVDLAGALSAAPGTGGRVLIVRDGSGLCAAFVDECGPPVNLPIQQVDPALKNWSRGSVIGYASRSGILVPILDPAALRAASPIRPAANPPAISSVQPIATGTGAPNHSRVVLFDVGPKEQSVTLGLSLEQVPEIRDDLSHAMTPGAPPWILGVATWRLMPATALDFGLLFGHGPTPADRWLIVRGFEERELFLVPSQRDVRITEAESATNGSPIPGWATCWMHGAYAIESREFLFPDLSAVSRAWRGLATAD